MEHLYIRLIEQGVGELYAEWVLLGATYTKIVSAEKAAPLASIMSHIPPVSKECKVSVLVPGQHVLLTYCVVPRNQRRHLHKILPFIVEDQLAEPLSAVHIVAGLPSNAKESVAVAVVKTTVMQGWLSLLNEAGVVPQVLIAEHSLLTKTHTMLSDGKTTWLRIDGDTVFTVESSMQPDLMALMLGKSAEAIVLQCVASSPEAEEQFLQIQAEYPHITLKITKAESVLEVLCEDLALLLAASYINLMQGAFHPREYRSPSTKMWTLLSRFAAVWFMAMLVLNGGQAGYLSYKSTQMHNQAIALYKQLFPADTKIVNPRKQMESYITGTSSSQAGFLPLIQRTAIAWSAGDISLQMQTINYRENDNSLTLSIKGKTIDMVNKVIERLEGNAVTVKMQSVVNNSGEITAQLLVRGGGR